jgi:hypothetical protein
MLKNEGLSRTAKFTGLTGSDEREALLSSWAANELDGMVATSAFGLGVDKHDVRAVVHATLPESLDRYYQEVGRAGRDGSACAALLLYTDADVEQARRMATPKMISDDRGYTRWTGMLDGAVRDSSAPEVYWVDLRHLPADLQVSSDASREWSVRTLTLMARAGLVELIALEAADGSDETAGTPAEMQEAARAAIRLRADGHRNRDTFGRVMTGARTSVFGASVRAFDSMVSVARGQQEIAAALVDMYSVRGGGWVPVASCCGGCNVHWQARRQTVLYEGPVTPRLDRFRPPNLSVFEELRLPMECPHLLVVAIAPNAAFQRTALDVLGALVPILSCHTVTMDDRFAREHGAAVAGVVPRTHRLQTFFDTVGANEGYKLVAGEGEVRVVVWTAALSPSVWDQLVVSRARLEVLLVPSDMVHPLHATRRLVDTTVHIEAASLLQRIYS